MQQTCGPASTPATRLLFLTCFDADLVSGRTNGADGPAPPGRNLLQAGRLFLTSERKPVTGLGMDKCSVKQQVVLQLPDVYKQSLTL